MLINFQNVGDFMDVIKIFIEYYKGYKRNEKREII